MNYPHKATLDAEPERSYSIPGRQKKRLPRQFPPMPNDSEAWGLNHKRLMLYWAVYIALFTALMMLFL